MTTHSLTSVPLARLKRVVRIREQIESLEFELGRLLGASAFIAMNGATPTEKSDARWFGRNGGHDAQPRLMSGNQRLSRAGRAKISAVVTARWEKYRAAKAKALKAG